MNIVVSIIIPIYNAEKFLHRSIGSCLKQTYSNIEIILVNDGSTDNSEEICMEYVKKYLKIKYVKQQNQGQGFARNKGVEIARGDYFLYLDADDTFELDTVEELMRFIEKNECDLVMFGFRILSNNAQETFRVESPIANGVYTKNIIKEIVLNTIAPEKWTADKCQHSLGGNNYAVHSGRLLYRREFIERNELKFKLRNYEDFTYPIECLIKAKTLGSIKRSFYNYYSEANSNSTTHTIGSTIIIRRLEQADEMMRLAYLTDYSKGFLERAQMRTAFVLESVFYTVVNETDFSIKEKYSLISSTLDDERIKKARKTIKFSGNKFDIGFMIIKYGWILLIMLYCKTYSYLLSRRIQKSSI